MKEERDKEAMSEKKLFFVVFIDDCNFSSDYSNTIHE